MSAIEKLLEHSHRVATKKDTRRLFELLCAGATEEKNIDAFIWNINAHWLEEIEYFFTGPFSLEQDGIKIGKDEIYIHGRDAHTGTLMNIRLVDTPDSNITGIVEVKYHDGKWDEHHLGDLRIWIPKN